MVRPTPASRGLAYRSRVAALEGLPPPKRRCTGGNRSWGPQTAQSPLEDTLLAALECLATKAWRARGGGWLRPDPRVAGPDRGDRVHKVAPLYLESIQTFTPHFHWIAAAQRCNLWLVAKRIGLWLNRVFDAAEDYRLQHAPPKFLEALREMSPDTWRSCLHVSTPPVPRAVGVVDDTILDKGLGPIGDFPLPQDFWDSVVPEFYRDGLRDFNMQENWEDVDSVVKGASRWVF